MSVGAGGDCRNPLVHCVASRDRRGVVRPRSFRAALVATPMSRVCAIAALFGVAVRPFMAALCQAVLAAPLYQRRLVSSGGSTATIGAVAI